jgi:translation initiation factor 1 (eIF-1/SUI1)
MSAKPGQEVYFEMTRLGASVRVAAIDAATGVEVTVVGPASAAQSDLQKLALAKLKVRLAKGSE